MSTDLAATFLRHLDPSLREQATGLEDLEQMLAKVMDAATTSWPDFELTAPVFLAYLARRAPLEGELAAYLGHTVRLADLYLACACARGDPAAIAAFETTHLPDIRRALAWIGLGGAAIEEMQQQLRQQLFVPDEGNEPKIARFSGRSRLRRWLRVTAVHLALQQLEQEKRLPRTGDLPLELAAADEGPEMQLLRRQHQEAFKAAMEQALSRLTPRQQNLLRYLYLDGLTTEEIGALYHVHRSTASRWLSAAREEVLAQARQGLMQQLDLDRAQCDSLMRVLGSDVELTLSRVLRREPDQ